MVGYAHYKKTPSFRAETDVWIESNPYQARVLVNTQFSLALNMKLTNVLLKLSLKQEITEEEVNEIKELQVRFLDHIENRTISNKNDQSYFKENYKL